ncbi:MAG TPA: alcohol dehydrogenase catalytic domain-containing protein, partial [Acetobacteraceae bacterium]|nr:alcohol dehydrogenase catalytic domain-containing protein [Acetobacteraceae bacterium]
MPKIRVVQVREKGGPFELAEREQPDPGAGQVRVRVQACGVCHSDSLARDGLYPNVPYPIVLGHEIAGVIDAVGRDVVGWTEGTRAGVGWFGGHCGHCEPCRRGYLIDCRNLRIPGISYDGGYAEAVVVPADALALLPDEIAPAEAAPLLCAGVTTYHALRESGARAGDLVAILGIGGLGHLGVQFARKMGFRTVAIARGRDKESLARQLGAHVYLDSQAQDVAAELT